MNDQELARLISNIGSRLDKIDADINKQSAVQSLRPGDGQAMIYQVPVDLTTANNGIELKAPRPFDWIQVWTDGVLNGISITLQGRGAETFDLAQMPVIPVTSNPDNIYLTSDVRQGRSRAVVYFVRGPSPLQLSMGGQDISLSELAIRNGSIHTFDQRGNVFWQDDFEGGIGKWTPAFLGAGTGSSFTASADRAHSGNLSGKLIPGNIATNYARITHNEAYPSLVRIGGSLYFSHDTAISIYYFYLILYDGTTSYSTFLRYTTATNTLAIQLPGAGVFVDLSPIVVLNSANNVFNFVKLVFDASTKKYVRVILNNIQFDLSAYALMTAPDATSPSLKIGFYIENGGVTNPAVYVDDAIITQNEP